MARYYHYVMAIFATIAGVMIGQSIIEDHYASAAMMGNPNMMGNQNMMMGNYTYMNQWMMQNPQYMHQWMAKNPQYMNQWMAKNPQVMNGWMNNMMANKTYSKQMYGQMFQNPQFMNNMMNNPDFQNKYLGPWMMNHGSFTWNGKTWHR